MAKKRPPGWKPKDKKQNTPNFHLYAGQDAEHSIRALLERMEKNPENFAFGGSWSSDDDHQVPDDLEGTGYMCVACAMPAEPPLSACCSAPVVDVGD
jgi:hypothetical protein